MKHAVDGKPAIAYGVECYHVNARLSQTVQDIGGFQLRKLGLLLGYCVQAVWIRFRYGVPNFYYVPAPSQPAALYRDWIVMVLCRPFFKAVILHWHAAGLVNWLEHSVPKLTRRISIALMRRVGLSIVLSNYNRADAERLHPLRMRVVSNGIPDPCPGFERDLLPVRLARFGARNKLCAGARLSSEELRDAGGDPHIIKVLFLGLCSREKGLFDALDGIALANRKFTESRSALRFRLVIGGEFLSAADRQEFDLRVSRPDLQLPETHFSKSTAISDSSAVEYLGFVSGKEKARAFSRSDCLCFPTYYHAESFGLVLIEAMAYGLPIVATRWRSLPELLPNDYPGLVDTRSPDQLAETLITLVLHQTGEALRGLFLSHFTLEQYLKNLAEALRSVNAPADAEAV